MGICSSEEKIPNSGLYNYDELKEKIIINSIERINFKDLFLENLTPEFLKLFRTNINLFYSQPFIEGISYEYGLFGKSIDPKKALKIYKDAADNKYDYLCMYRMHRIYLVDYNYFKIKKSGDLHRLYLYKCFAYLPYLIINKSYYLLNKIDVSSEIFMLLQKFENSKYEIFDKFMDFLEINQKQFKVTSSDIKLMKNVLKIYFSDDFYRQNINKLNVLLDFDMTDYTNFEAKLKYCNFYLDYSGNNCDKQKIENIFDNLIKSGYYKVALDYGRFLIMENRYDEAKIIFKKGSDDRQQFCFAEYIFLLLSTTDLNQLLKDYNLISYFLKNHCIVICVDKLGQGSFYYMIYYLIKHTSFKQQIKNDFGKYAKEIFENVEKYFKIENSEFMNNIFSESKICDFTSLFGDLNYFGIKDIINSDREKSLFYYKKSYQLSKKIRYNYSIRINYLYIYKCRKYLYKYNKLSLRKLNKTKEKLFRIYEESNLDDLNPIHLYNYYKLYKIDSNEIYQNKIISILKKSKNKRIYSFGNYIYKEKCKFALEKEYSKVSVINKNKALIRNETFDKNGINLYFKTMENKQYNLRVSKTIQFIIAIHKLYSKYPELESKNIATYVCNGNKVCLFDTIQENNLQEGNIILIINKFN